MKEREGGPFGSLCMNHTLTCCLNGGGRKAVWQTRVRHGNNDANPTAVAVRLREASGKLTSLNSVSVGAVDDLSLRARLRWVGLGDGGMESWDRFVFEWPATVVGTVDVPREDSEMVNCSKLIPTMAGCVLSARVLTGYKESRDVQRS